MTKNESHIFVIFGASGDLTRRKLVPALYSLYVQHLLPEKFALLGVSRSSYSDVEFRSMMSKAITEFKEIEDTDQIDRFIENVFYSSLPIDDISAYPLLAERLKGLRSRLGISGNTIYYLSTPPGLYGIIPQTPGY